jgi:hypothetical protein
MLALGGATPHPDYPLDGVSLQPVLRDPAATFERPLFWRMNHRGQRACRIGRWKYLQVDGHEYLFDIPADERERASPSAWPPCARPGWTGRRRCRPYHRTPPSAWATAPRTCRNGEFVGAVERLSNKPDTVRSLADLHRRPCTPSAPA